MTNLGANPCSPNAGVERRGPNQILRKNTHKNHKTSNNLSGATFAPTVLLGFLYSHFYFLGKQIRRSENDPHGATNMAFDRAEYKEKVTKLHQQILEDLRNKGLKDDDIDATQHGGLEQETIVENSQVIGWIVKVHLKNHQEPLTYKLDNKENGELTCNNEPVKNQKEISTNSK